MPRSCDCPQWDENRLQERAEQIVARNPNYRLYCPPQGALDPGVDAVAAAGPEELRAIPQEVAHPDNGALDAQRPVQHIPAAQNAAAGVHLRNLVAQVRGDLQRNHECDHKRWNFHRGRHSCEECGDMLPQYIFECVQCHIRACWRCRRNRL